MWKRFCHISHVGKLSMLRYSKSDFLILNNLESQAGYELLLDNELDRIVCICIHMSANNAFSKWGQFLVQWHTRLLAFLMLQFCTAQ